MVGEKLRIRWEDLRVWLERFQWARGLRAAVAVGSALLVCHLLHRPLAAAALGAFNPLLVDNGGPYRTRLTTMLTALLGGALALVLGLMMPPLLPVVIVATMAVCFSVTFARVISQPVASSSVLIMVSYFAGLGGFQHNLRGALGSVALLMLGGAWAILLSLLFWPLDPFRPARLAVSRCFGSLGELTAELAAHVDDEDAEKAAHEGRRRHRLRVEEARSALAATAARAPSRTSRARNLTVLLETSDMLLARNIRLTELAEFELGQTQSEAHARIRELARWLAAAEQVIREGLEHRPADAGASFAREGSQRVQYLTRRRNALGQRDLGAPDALIKYLLTEEREALLEVEIAFDAVRAIWIGAEVPQSLLIGEDGVQRALSWNRSRLSLVWLDTNWMEALHANWTLDSAMLRHALRLMVVGAVDVVVMRLIHINHGFWLPMTSIILMQPYSAGTARKSVQRVTGSVAGGIFAAVLAAVVPDVASMIAVLTLLSALTLATFAVDYAIYCFFLTPTFVLLSLPYPHDWRYAGIRIGTTLAGALIAVLAMRLLWPERAEIELGRLLRRGALADAHYLRALLLFWNTPSDRRRIAERNILAPARRACGLASNDAEEAVDRVMQDPHLPRTFSLHGSWRAVEDRSDTPPLTEQALTFATYLRRLTQSITTLAFVGLDSPVTHDRLEHLAARLEGISNVSPERRAGEARGLETSPSSVLEPLASESIADEQMRRIERQTSVLERVAATL